MDHISFLREFSRNALSACLDENLKVRAFMPTLRDGSGH